MMELIYGEKEIEMDGINGLPKNVCQIGIIEGKNSIYIESYVAEYMQSFLEKTVNTYFVLLGEKSERETETVYFVSAAIRLSQMEIETEYDLKKRVELIRHKYFTDKNLLGCAMSDIHKDGIEILDEELLKKLYPQNRKSLVFHLTSKESMFYIYEDSVIKRERGYYQYISEHRSMDSYIEEEYAKENCENETEIKKECIEEEDVAVLHFRDIMKEKQSIKKQRLWMNLISALNMVLLILVSVIGISMINSYEKMNQINLAIAKMEPIKVEENEQVLIGDDQSEEEDSVIRSEIISENQVEGTNAVNQTYIVKQGDTLNGISNQFYQSLDMVDQICQLNQIGDKNIIVCGQEILLP